MNAPVVSRPNARGPGPAGGRCRPRPASDLSPAHPRRDAGRATGIALAGKPRGCEPPRRAGGRLPPRSGFRWHSKKSVRPDILHKDRGRRRPCSICRSPAEVRDAAAAAGRQARRRAAHADARASTACWCRRWRPASRRSWGRRSDPLYGPLLLIGAGAAFWSSSPAMLALAASCRVAAPRGQRPWIDGACGLAQLLGRLSGPRRRRSGGDRAHGNSRFGAISISDHRARIADVEINSAGWSARPPAVCGATCGLAVGEKIEPKND